MGLKKTGSYCTAEKSRKMMEEERKPHVYASTAAQKRKSRTRIRKEI